LIQPLATIMTITVDMGFSCPFCGSQNAERDNVYGTICYGCEKYIPPETKPKFVREHEEKLVVAQNIIREYLRRKILGETHGNKVEQKD